MVKKLTVIGNSLGLIIERPILDLLNISRDTPLEVTTDGEALILRPARKKMPKRTRIRQSARRLMEAHDETFKKLAR